MDLFLNLLAGVLVGLVPAAVYCALAGRWDVWNAWVTAGIFVAWATVQALALYQKSPDQLKVRLKTAAGGRVRLTVGLAYPVATLLAWSVAGLDQRFHWSNIVPPAGVVAGIVIFTIGGGLFTWSLLVNAFFVPEVRIQAERGHRVVDTGPYAIVRHPSYASLLLLMVASGLALNSLLVILPAAVFAAVVVQDTAIEDQMLQEELAGYAGYAARVRYRLVPGLW